MDMTIITAIVQRVIAHHSTEDLQVEARMEIYDNETWCVMLIDGACETLAYSGESFTELPSLLSSLK